MNRGNCVFSVMLYIPCLENELTRREKYLHTVHNNTTLSSTKILKLVYACRKCSKPKECHLRDTVCSMTEKAQFPRFMFMFPQVVQRR